MINTRIVATLLLTCAMWSVETSNQTIIREQSGKIPSIYGDARYPICSTMPAIGLPYSDPTIRLSAVSWTPYWGSGTPAGLAGGSANPSDDRRIDTTLQWTQGLNGAGWVSAETGIVVSKDDSLDSMTLGDIWTGLSFTLARSRYSGLSLGMGTYNPTGSKDDWIGSHGNWTPYVNLRGTLGFSFFTFSVNGQVETNIQGGRNTVQDVAGVEDDIRNDYRAFLSSAVLTYRVCRYFRIGLEQDFNWRGWKMYAPINYKTHVENAPTRAVVEFTSIPGLKFDLNYGRDWLSNRDADEAIYGKGQRTIFGGGATYVF